jgi:hypothetical protein
MIKTLVEPFLPTSSRHYEQIVPQPVRGLVLDTLFNLFQSPLCFLICKEE